MEKEEVELLIQKLAASIADKIKPAVPFEPDFPKRIELPTAEGRITHPRWKAAEVTRWVEGYKT